MWLKTIPQKYSKEAITILKKLHLITFIDEFIYQTNKELACQKYKYPSTKGEHIMLNLAEMFALTLSSGNVQIITENFCSKYLNKYAAGKEEHADVKIKQGSDEEHFSVTAPKLSNNKITGSALFRKSEIEKHKGNVVSALQVSNRIFVVDVPTPCDNYKHCIHSYSFRFTGLSRRKILSKTSGLRSLLRICKRSS